ncbi:tetratricopeptide repeat protein [Stackebrandtia albiflava]|uniref:Tetratricopeptide repeat protein n=1 Tax=Stackebrandtia albiflava TaxID=406432 RepID=A0A562UQB1_9ACTN|nr:tetratricopeptide repeat protein [Stackebrandtia albiflava]TWJ07784.1 tetratricopeptide repeat protein [Stackebrandtia albiflava]
MSPTAIDDLRLYRFAVRIESPATGFLGSGFFVAPGYALTCAHVVAKLPDGATVNLAAGPGASTRELRGVVRGRTPAAPGADGLWAWPDLALIEVRDPGGAPHTTHPCPRVDLSPSPPTGPRRHRAVVAVRPNPDDARSAPRFRCVDFIWETVDDHGFWWLTTGHAQRGMSGGMLLDAETGTVVAVVNNRRHASGAVATPLSALATTLPAETVIALHTDTTAFPEWDAAFTRRHDDGWQDYWAPDNSGTRFVGREDELSQLREQLDRAGGLAVVQSIGGFGGVGKTALAVAFGNRFKAGFPDGRVFHDFRSYRDSRSDTATDALGSVLVGVGAVPADEIGRLDHRARVDRWQAAAAGRRLLMIWDNVDSVTQLDGLLVRGDGCATIVTSRELLRVEGNIPPMRLGILEEADAIAMFRMIAGDDHPLALVTELVRRDLYVPVLIGTHAEEVANHETSLEEIIEDLPEPSSARHVLTHVDHQRDLFDRLAGSYRRLDPDARFALRVLGAHPGYDATLASLAAGMGCDTHEAERRMKRLDKAGFAERNHTGHRDRTLRGYRAHDLIRAYGLHLAEQETAGDTDEKTAIRAALIDHFQRLLDDNRDNFNDWFGVEADSIRDLALTGTGPAHGRLARYLGYRGVLYNRCDAAEVGFRHAMLIDEKHGDRTRVAHSHWGLGEAARLRGDLDAADGHYRAALEVSTSVGDDPGIGNAQRGLGEIAQLRGDDAAAEDRYGKAIAAYEAAGKRRRVAYVLRGLARVAELRQDFALADERFREALAVSRDEGDGVAVAYTLRGLGDIALLRADLTAATGHYTDTVAAFEALGDPVGVATGRRGLALVAEAHGDLDTAREVLTAVIEVFTRHDSVSWLERAKSDLARLSRRA